MIYKKSFSFRGQALVEMGLLLIILLIIVMIVLDLGRAFYYYTVVSNAAREGARFGIVNHTHPDGIEAAKAEIRVVAKERAVGLALEDDDIDVIIDNCNTIEECKVNVTVSYSFDSATPGFWKFVGFTDIDSIGVSGTSSMRIEE